MLNTYRPRSAGDIPEVVKNLMIINGLFFLATIFAQEKYRIDLTNTLALYYFSSEYFRPWQLITHIFMHADRYHIFFNMLGLWFFGSALENIWGPRRFLIYYMFTGIGASLLHNAVIGVEILNLQHAVDVYAQNLSADSFNYFVNNHVPQAHMDFFLQIRDALEQSPNDPLLLRASLDYAEKLVTWKENSSAIGASGAVFGILMGCGYLFPNTEIRLLFIPVPIKIKYLVTFLGVAELYRGFRNDPTDNVAHFAHLGGMLFGYILIKYWNKTNRKTLY